MLNNLRAELLPHGDEVVDKIEAKRNTRYYKSVGLSQSDRHPVLPIRYGAGRWSCDFFYFFWGVGVGN